MQLEKKPIQEDLELIFPVISGKVSMAISRLMSRNFRKAGVDITPEQWTVLAYLWRQDGVSQQHLCNATFKDKPSMTRLIDNLEKLEYVTRESSLSDRRTNLVYLTSKARSIKDKCNEAVAKVIGLSLKGVSEERFAHQRQLMHTIFSNIQEALESQSKD